jgi:micrococcal nuclease
LVKILNGPGALKISTDPKLDKTDRYGRLLRYVFKGNINVNLKLVEIGAASPYFYRGELGIYSSKLLASAKNAKAKSLGLWSKCPGTVLDPVNAITTQSSIAYPKNAPGVSSICDANYQGCVPQFPPDLDCPDIKRLGLAPVRVIGKDVHKLDRDGDGIGCDK